jgi:hypothetical protein
MRVQSFVENVVVATLCEAKLSVKLVFVVKTALVELVKTSLLIGEALKGLCFLQRTYSWAFQVVSCTNLFGIFHKLIKY